MTITYKVLGQLNPTLTTATNIYTVSSGISAVVSTINVCNQANAAATFRVAVRPLGAALSAVHYISYETSLPAYDSISLSIGITLAATDIITVYASSSTVSFSVFGSEIS